MRGPLPQEEFDHIFSRDPRLAVELVIASDDRGVLLALRDFGPCQGLWHLPGGTVRFGEPLVEAVKRVAQDELGLTVSIGQLLGYIEYPSHYDHGLDSPVGLAFRADVAGDLRDEHDPRADPAWFTVRPTTCTTSKRGSALAIWTSSRHDDGANLRSACTAPRAYKPNLPTSDRGDPDLGSPTRGARHPPPS